MIRYYTDLEFPQPDSFPHIFVDERGEPLEGSVSVKASLSTDSAVSDGLGVLRNTVMRSIGLEDREELGNALDEMADEYHQGWSSGSDEGDDE